MQAGLSDGALKSIKQITHLGDQLREWDRNRIQLEAMSGVQASSDLLYQAGLRDARLRMLHPALSKVGLMGGTHRDGLEPLWKAGFRRR